MKNQPTSRVITRPADLKNQNYKRLILTAQQYQLFLAYKEGRITEKLKANMTVRNSADTVVRAAQDQIEHLVSSLASNAKKMATEK